MLVLLLVAEALFCWVLHKHIGGHSPVPKSFPSKQCDSMSQSKTSMRVGYMVQQQTCKQESIQIKTRNIFYLFPLYIPTHLILAEFLPISLASEAQFQWDGFFISFILIVSGYSSAICFRLSYPLFHTNQSPKSTPVLA